MYVSTRNENCLSLITNWEGARTRESLLCRMWERCSFDTLEQITMWQYSTALFSDETITNQLEAHEDHTVVSKAL